MNMEEFIRERYGPSVKIEKMTSDASDRIFYRIKKGEGSLVLMKCAASFKESELPYINIWRFLKNHSFRVPQILGIHPENGILIMSDLGEALLQNSILYFRKEKNLEEIKSLYKKGIEIIVDLQLKGTPALDDRCLASQYSLDKKLFLFELNFFYEHYVKGLLKLNLKDNEEEELTSWFVELADKVSGFGRVLCHRDFHSRNLLMVHDELYMTDFQDARLGPCTYDLASFLRDSYIAQDEEFIDGMLDFYLSLVQEKIAEKQPLKEITKDSFLKQWPVVNNVEERERFKREFDLTSIQRNIKAIGTFAYQSYVKKNHNYLQYIPATWSYVRTNLKKLDIDLPSLNFIISRQDPIKRKS